MINYHIISAQSVKHKFIDSGIDIYLKKLTGQVKIKFIDLGIKSKVSTIEEQLNKEAEKILTNIPRNSFIISLDERGQMLKSSEMATLIKKQTIYGKSNFCFIIGSAYGLSKTVTKSSDLVMSLSKLTFTYELTKLILLEQLYRATMIIAGKPYHKE